MSLEESLVVEQESLEESLKTLKESHKTLRNFMYSTEFLEDRVKFFKLLGDFQDNLVTLVEVAESLPPLPPMPPLPEKQPLEALPEQKAETATLVFGKALIVAVTIITAGIAVVKGILPAETLKWIASATIILVFLPQTINLIRVLLKERGERELSMNLQDWVTEAHEAISEIRNKYLEAWMRIRVQNQRPEDLPEYRTLGVDEVLYSRKEQYKVTLPVEFENKTGSLMVKCEKSIWLRKGAVIAAATHMLQREYRESLTRGGY